MARFTEPTEAQEEVWRNWVSERPAMMRAMAEKFDPWSLYRMKSTGQRVAIASFNEDGTISVFVSGEFNFVIHDRQVFGIKPDDLEPCDLPDPNEPVGTAMSPSEVDENIDALRVLVRPDLFVMGADGKAQRKS